MIDQRALCVLGCRSSSGGPYPADYGYLTCARCADRLRGVVVEVTERYAIVGTASLAALETMVVCSEQPVIRKAGFESRSPASDHLIAMRDHRSTAVEPGDPHSPLAILWSWARVVRDERQLAAPTSQATVDSEANTLLFHWDWVMRQSWVDDMARELREVASQLRHVTGEPKPKPVGTCIEPVDTNDGQERCGQPLYAPTSGQAITCRACERVYDGMDLVRLYMANREEAA